MVKWIVTIFDTYIIYINILITTWVHNFSHTIYTYLCNLSHNKNNERSCYLKFQNQSYSLLHPFSCFPVIFHTWTPFIFHFLNFTQYHSFSVLFIFLSLTTFHFLVAFISEILIFPYYVPIFFIQHFSHFMLFLYILFSLFFSPKFQ